MNDDLVTDRPPCALCGVHGRPDEIRSIVVEWLDPVAGRLYDAVPRCEDRLACRQRVESKDPKERWPLVHMSGDPWSRDQVIDPPPPNEQPVAAADPPAPPVVEPPGPPVPSTWSATFVDEPEEDRSWV